jgi:diguanylate cyclase (GGDEF)-like protein
MPKGLKLDTTFTSLTIGNSIEHPAGSQTLGDALEGQTVGLSQWLTESDSVVALLLAPDGSIRARNRAGYRVFPPDPTKNLGLSIWDYLVCSDVQDLRQRLSGEGTRQDARLLLNVANGQQDPITLEVGLVLCSGAILLLGSQERRHDSQFETEILKLTNDLSLMARESARKNRELNEANETIERLARTDPLTGLANRRTLDETFGREIARTERLQGDLSMIIGDQDHFKSINDQYGHIIGDQVLAHAAAVLKSQSRPYDLAARYGGEEFVLVLPGTSTNGAIATAEAYPERDRRSHRAWMPEADYDQPRRCQSDGRRGAGSVCCSRRRRAVQRQEHRQESRRGRVGRQGIGQEREVFCNLCRNPHQTASSLHRS